MDSLLLASHPAWWRSPVTPADIGIGGLHLVPNGAIASGVRVDALVTFDACEGTRRGNASMGSVCSLALLDVLLGLPLGCPIGVADLTERETRLLTAAPQGCTEKTSSSVTRLLSVPATVVAAVVRAARWRTAVLRTVAFSAFTQRVIVLQAPPRAVHVLEARYAGVGIWVESNGAMVEHVAPAPFRPRYFKAAGWQFAEKAYGAAVAAGVLAQLRWGGGPSPSSMVVPPGLGMVDETM